MGSGIRRLRHPGTMLLSAVLSAAALSAVVPMQKLGAYVMQAGETSPVNWKGRTLLVEATTGDTIDLQGRPTYACCICRTFGCVANASAPIGYVDCSGCAGTCTAAQKKAWGSCAPEFIRVRDLKTLKTLQKIPGSEGFGFANAPVAVVAKWQALLKNYLQGRPTLRLPRGCLSASRKPCARSTGKPAR